MKILAYLGKKRDCVDPVKRKRLSPEKIGSKERQTVSTLCKKKETYNTWKKETVSPL